MKTILAVTAVLLASCASAPTSSPSRASSKVTVVADRSVTQSEADVFRKVALDRLKDVGALSVDINLMAGEHDGSLVSRGGFTAPSLGPFTMGGDGAILNGMNTNIAPNANVGPLGIFSTAARDSIDLNVIYVIRDASGNVVDGAEEAIRFTSSDHVRTYQNVVNRIAKRVKRVA